MTANTLITLVEVAMGGLALCVAGLWCDWRARAGHILPDHFPRSAPARPPVLTLDPSQWSAPAVRRLMRDVAATPRREAGPRWGRITTTARYQDVGDVFEQLGLQCDDQPRRSEA